ncbi:ArnT family glycosyltransferase [Nocardia miyunensis]|uniref:ArnT family glycosyltransferase n=1 Tax=Nocardia miyunensis TaxID=282684 RepID=UPI000A0011A0|nr:glycosyltransferase family 39 protein [Nocardia miyunensis]
MAALLIGTAVAYLWNLSINGWANSFYAAAVQSGAKSWKAFFFGSSDWANSITVDKTPASLWPMEISVRLFGLHSWSMLTPQALLGVASVLLTWITLRRTAGTAAGLLGGLALAVTPVAAMMFRFDNPDALLVFLMTASVWAMTRALDSGRWRWLVLCGVLVGLGFLAKQLQVLLVLPALAITYLVAGPPRLGKRLLQLLAAGAAMVAGAGWWVLTAQLWPVGSRPYFGGSEHNSTIELTLGYNGLQRLGGGSMPNMSDMPNTGNGPMPNMGNSSMPDMGNGSMPGIGNGKSMPHMPGFGSDAGIGRMFTESIGGQVAWLIPAALILLVAGIIVRGRASRTDPQRAALLLWGGWALVTGLVFSFMKGLFHQYYTVSLAAPVAGLTGLAAVLVWRERHRYPIRIVLAVATVLTTVTSVILLSRTPDFVPWLRWVVTALGAVATLLLLVPRPDRPAVAGAIAAIVTALAGPAAYSVETIATPHTGSVVLAGPKTDSDVPPMGSETVGPELVARLGADAQRFTWVAATPGAMASADLQLAVRQPVMPIGGFSSMDPSPTLAQFQRYVTEGRIHYYLSSDMPGWGTTTESSKIAAWVQQHFTATKVDGKTVYDLTARPTAR